MESAYSSTIRSWAVGCIMLPSGLINSHSQVSHPGPEGPLVTPLLWCCLESNLGRPTLKAYVLPAELSNITVLKTLPMSQNGTHPIIQPYIKN